MAGKPHRRVSVESAFDTYTLQDCIGEGGTGRVYSAIASDGSAVAVKVLKVERVTSDQQRRFKNEIAFLRNNQHPNIVSVLDDGVAVADNVNGPFYVMRHYGCSLRKLIGKDLIADSVLAVYTQILDGVEAAHLKGVVHRDLKPENLLCDDGGTALAVADFGIAHFTGDLLVTQAETTTTQRLANFAYAAPEQRRPGTACTAATDIYALGLILNEMFTDVIPQGTGYRTIGSVAPQYAYLDGVVASMMLQSQEERPQSIAQVKNAIQKHSEEALVLQKISQLDGTVVPQGEVDDPLALTPPVVIDFDWDGTSLRLTLDRELSGDWVAALRSAGVSYLLSAGPDDWNFRGREAWVTARDSQVQPLIDQFRQWLPLATSRLRMLEEQAFRRDEARRQQQLKEQRELEERRLRVLRDVKI